MKKMMAMLLALAVTLLMVACSACDDDTAKVETSTDSKEVDMSKTNLERSKERYEEPIEINIVLAYRDSEDPNTPDSITPETATLVKMFKDELNIDLKYSWIVNTDQYDTKFNAELAAGTIPDIMQVGSNMFEDLANQGALKDMTEAFEMYNTDATNDVFNFDGEVINAGMKDGKIYGLPNSTHPAQSTSQIYYDLNMLKQVGIESVEDLPTTIAEFEALCDEIMKIDIDGDGKTGEPVFAANKHYMNAGLADFSPIFHAYDTTTIGWYDDGSGTLQNHVTNTKIQEPLTKLNDWYDKGYFQKDFAAQDVWGANAPVVSDIIAGEYAIVMGSWWIPNWPLNSNKENNPDADWVVGPTLTLDGGTPTTFIKRYPVANFTVVSHDFEYPEALFKMMQLSLDYSAETSHPDFEKNATEEELLAKYSNVYTWLPFRTYNPNSIVENFKFINEFEESGATKFDVSDSPNNSEFWGAYASYVAVKEGLPSAAQWGLYTSRIAPNGGVAKMSELYENSNRIYDETLVTTPSMITKGPEMDKFVNSTILSMVMGETPISDYEKFVEQWKGLGGSDVESEINEWYKNN